MNKMNMRSMAIGYGGLAAVALILSLLWQMMLPPAAQPAAFVMQFYRNAVGQLDGRTCPSYPVCSIYADAAIRKHGLLVGSWLMLDRIIHEHDDLSRGHWLTINGEQRLYDPLARNDFWLQDFNNREE